MAENNTNHYESAFVLLDKVYDSSFDPLNYSINVSPKVLEVFSSELFAHCSSNMTNDIRHLPDTVKESMELEYLEFSKNINNSRFIVETSDPWVSQYLVHYVLCAEESPADCGEYFESFGHTPSVAELKELWALLHALDKIHAILDFMDSNFIYVCDHEKREYYTFHSDQKAPLNGKEHSSCVAGQKENENKYDFYFSKKQFREMMAVGCAEQLINGRLYTDCVEEGGYPKGQYDDHSYVDTGPFKNTFNWADLKRGMGKGG